MQHEGSRSVFTGPAQIERLKVTLRNWLDKLFTGPYDESYYELRSRIGRMHVKIALPQHYMFTAMNVIRSDLHAILFDLFRKDPDRLFRATTAVSRILDLELAIMLETYRSDLLGKLKRQDRLATIGKLAASMNHELKNPLGVILSSLFILKRKIPAEPGTRIHSHFEKIERNIERANRIISQLLSFTRAKAPEARAISVGSVCEIVRQDLDIPPGIELEVGFPEALPPVSGDLFQLSIVFRNLIDNAFEAMPGGGSSGSMPFARGERSSFVSRTRGRGSPRNFRKRSSNPSSRPAPRARALALRSAGTSWRPMGGGSPFRVNRTGEQCLRSPCRSLRRGDVRPSDPGTRCRRQRRFPREHPGDPRGGGVYGLRRHRRDGG
ncbi:MAG: hypothetical protein D6795_17555, partial [Deltaproteobacteria bacterium]